MKHRVILLSLLLCLAQPFAAKKQNTPDEISSAHTVAVVAHAVKGGGGRYLGISNPSLEAQLSAEAQESLGRAPGLSVIGDPGQADLVLLLLLADWKTRYGEDLGLIFPGGRTQILRAGSLSGSEKAKVGFRPPTTSWQNRVTNKRPHWAFIS